MGEPRSYKRFFVDINSPEWKAKMKEYDEILDKKLGSERHELYPTRYDNGLSPEPPRRK